MIHDPLPALHQPLVDLIRSVAPDAKVGLLTTTQDDVSVRCDSADGGGMTLRHDSEGQWRTRGRTLVTELDLVEVLCEVLGAPRLAGPADIVEMRKHPEDFDDMTSPILWQHCNAALDSMDSAAILACSRALPNNDWRKHQP